MVGFGGGGGAALWYVREHDMLVTHCTRVAVLYEVVAEFWHASFADLRTSSKD